MDNELIGVSNQFAFPLRLDSQSFRMWVVTDYLGRILPKMRNLGLERLSLILVVNLIQIYTIFVGERIEDVHILDCIFATLLVPIDDIYPLINVFRDVFALQLFAQFTDEKVGVFFGP